MAQRDLLCSNCIYFSPRVGSVGGLCRRLEPAAAAHPSGFGRWPRVRDNDWCGQHWSIGAKDISLTLHATRPL